MLSIAAFWTGTAWQPVVNALLSAAPSQAGNSTFVYLLLATWLVQSLVFFAALQCTRWLLHSLLRLEAIDSALGEGTLVYDASLSLSVGAGGGFFVATCGLPLANNLLTKAFGVQNLGGWAACGAAGGSMVTGFLVAQAAQNALAPVNTSWADSRKKGREQLRDGGEKVMLPYRTPFG